MYNTKNGTLSEEEDFYSFYFILLFFMYFALWPTCTKGFFVY